MLTFLLHVENVIAFVKRNLYKLASFMIDQGEWHFSDYTTQKYGTFIVRV